MFDKIIKSVMVLFLGTAMLTSCELGLSDEQDSPWGSFGFEVGTSDSSGTPNSNVFPTPSSSDDTVADANEQAEEAQNNANASETEASEKEQEAEEAKNNGATEEEIAQKEAEADVAKQKAEVDEKTAEAAKETAEVAESVAETEKQNDKAQKNAETAVNAETAAEAQKAAENAQNAANAAQKAAADTEKAVNEAKAAAEEAKAAAHKAAENAQKAASQSASDSEYINKKIEELLNIIKNHEERIAELERLLKEALEAARNAQAAADAAKAEAAAKAVEKAQSEETNTSGTGSSKSETPANQGKESVTPSPADSSSGTNTNKNPSGKDEQSKPSGSNESVDPVSGNSSKESTPSADAGNTAGGNKVFDGSYVEPTDPSTWKGTYKKFAFNVDKAKKVRLTVKTDSAINGQNVSLVSSNGYSSWNENPYIYPNGDGTVTVQLDLSAGRTYYLLSKYDNSKFEITNVEVIE